MNGPSNINNLSWAKIQLLVNLNKLHEAHSICRECAGDYDTIPGTTDINPDNLQDCVNSDSLSNFINWARTNTRNGTLIMKLGNINARLSFWGKISETLLDFGKELTGNAKRTIN